MSEESKSITESILRLLVGRADADRDDDTSDEEVEAKKARALMSALFARAGKGKDEVIHMVAREIGNAVAAMLKEPLALLAKNQKLQISFEFVPKQGHERVAAGKARRARSPRRAATRRPSPDSETNS
ncbi:MAG: hypothetical protein FJ146_09835 [Deltaproteobacteria bacterium]|nr:hypothetical protein [Deltaproteobacteria bacterium]